LGDMLSMIVATNTTGIARRIIAETENEYNTEKKTRAIVKLSRLPKNIAAEPSKLLFAMKLYLLLPYFSPTNDATESP